MGDFLIQDGVHGFAVCTKSNARVIMQIDFPSRKIQILDRGKEKMWCYFHECSSAVNTDGLWFEIQMKNKNKRLKAENIKEKRVIFSLIYSAIGRHPFDDTSPGKSIMAPDQTHEIIKKGYMEKKGNTVWEKWEKRLVCIKPGHFEYYKPHMKNALHIVAISEHTCYVERDGNTGFKVVVKDRNRTFWFRLTNDSTTDPNSFQFQRNEWILAFETACRGVRKTMWLDPLDHSRQSKTCSTISRCTSETLLFDPASRGHSGYSLIGDVNRSSQKCEPDESSKSDVFLYSDPFRPIPRVSVDSPMQCRTLPRRPSEKAEMYLTEWGKSNGKSGPPPLPIRRSGNFGIDIIPSEYDYTVVAFQRLKQEQQERLTQSNTLINTKHHSNSITHPSGKLHASFSDTMLFSKDAIAHDVIVQRRIIKSDSESGQDRFPRIPLSGQRLHAYSSDPTLLPNDDIDGSWKIESASKTGQDCFRSDRISHPYMNSGDLEQHELPEDDTNCYLNPRLNENTRLNSTSNCGGIRSSIQSNISERSETDPVEEVDNRFSFSSIKKLDVELHTSGIVQTDPSEDKEMETIQPEQAEPRQIKSMSLISDYGSECSSLGFPGISTDDESSPIVPQSAEKEVERRHYSLSIKKLDVELHTSGIVQTDPSEDKEMETIQPEQAEPRQIKSMSVRSDYDSGCSSLGFLGISTDDDSSPIIPESTEEEVERRHNSLSANGASVSLHISVIEPTDILENKTKERPKRPTKKPSRRIRLEREKQTPNKEDGPSNSQMNVIHDAEETDENTSTEVNQIDCSQVDSGNESCQSEIVPSGTSVRNIECVSYNQITYEVGEEVVL